MKQDIALSRYGARAKVWQFSPSLSRLALQLRFPGEAIDAYIIGVSCAHISGPIAWGDSRVEILEEVDEKLGTSHVVRDPTVHFELRCSGVSLVIATMSEFDLDAEAHVPSES